MEFKVKSVSGTMDTLKVDIGTGWNLKTVACILPP